MEPEMADMALPPKIDAEINKLPRLPRGAKIQKRPLLHPPVSSPYAGPQTAKVVYVSHKTPFVSAVKRVRGLLHHSEKRALQSSLSKRGKQYNNIHAAAKVKVDEDMMEEVTIRATGKAIERALNLALYFQQQADCKVRIGTGTVDAIDDVVVRPEKRRKVESGVDNGDKGGQVAERPQEPADVGHSAKKGEDTEDEVDLDALPEARVRHTSMLEIAVSLR